MSNATPVKGHTEHGQSVWLVCIHCFMLIEDAWSR